LTHISILLAIVFATYVLIVTEKLHRTTAVLFGSALIIILRYLTPAQAWGEYIDYNTLGLLAGMMVIIAIMRRSGLFQFVAIKLAKLARGSVLLIFASLMLLTALVSSVLDNTTTVLVVCPILLLIADGLGLNPLPFLTGAVIAANLGGASTLIGDPPNMLIATPSGLTFVHFISNMVPIVAVLLGVTVPLLWASSRRGLKVGPTRRLTMLAFDERKAVTDKRLLAKSLVVFGLTVFFFLIHSVLRVEPSLIALVGAAFLMLVSNARPEEVLREVHWPTLFFIAGLFIVVGAVDRQGLLFRLAATIISRTDTPLWVCMIVLWTSFATSALFGGIPATAALIPLIKHLGTHMSLVPEGMYPLWWALAIGVAVGSSSTLLGGIPNIVAAGISEKHGRAAARLSYWKYTRVSAPLMLINLAVASIYVYVRYFLFR
jgi:Na+/H+ antiporter NhaD/arsenite permease-like protein